jgi:hypothetical protein
LSVVQTALTHPSHPSASAAPAVHAECAHVPPDVEVALVELAVVELELTVVALELELAVVVELELAGEPLLDEALVDMLPHGFVLGMHALMWTPLASETSMHVLPAAQPVAAQFGAQYSSPANCAHNAAVPQSESWRQGMHAAGAPPVPPVPPDDEPVGADVVFAPPMEPVELDAFVVAPPRPPVVRPPLAVDPTLPV